MMKQCNTCPGPHISVEGFPTHPHPCHEDYLRPCAGHVLHLQRNHPTEIQDCFRIDGVDMTEEHQWMIRARKVWVERGLISLS